MLPQSSHQISRVMRDHLVFDLNNWYYISIVEESDNGYDSKELALMRYRPPAHSLDYGVSECVPLNKWFDSALGDDELAVDLNTAYGRYHLLSNDTPEALVIHASIGRALQYINDKEGI